MSLFNSTSITALVTTMEQYADKFEFGWFRVAKKQCGDIISASKARILRDCNDPSKYASIFSSYSDEVEKFILYHNSLAELRAKKFSGGILSGYWPNRVDIAPELFNTHNVVQICVEIYDAFLKILNITFNKIASLAEGHPETLLTLAPQFAIIHTFSISYTKCVHLTYHMIEREKSNNALHASRKGSKGSRPANPIDLSTHLQNTVRKRSY